MAEGGNRIDRERAINYLVQADENGINSFNAIQGLANVVSEASEKVVSQNGSSMYNSYSAMISQLRILANGLSDSLPGFNSKIAEMINGGSGGEYNGMIIHYSPASYSSFNEPNIYGDNAVGTDSYGDAIATLNSVNTGLRHCNEALAQLISSYQQVYIVASEHNATAVMNGTHEAADEVRRISDRFSEYVTKFVESFTNYIDNCVGLIEGEEAERQEYSTALQRLKEFEALDLPPAF